MHISMIVAWNNYHGNYHNPHLIVISSRLSKNKVPESVAGGLFYIKQVSFFSDVIGFFAKSKRIISPRPSFECFLHPGLNGVETRV